ncbi:MAG: hypothetical protein VYD90_10960 [Pseudomonadota bacterium]|nr:hypothetical protein [Pseudomonadota bacterium]
MHETIPLIMSGIAAAISLYNLRQIERAEAQLREIDQLREIEQRLRALRAHRLIAGANGAGRYIP